MCNLEAVCAENFYDTQASRMPLLSRVCAADQLHAIRCSGAMQVLMRSGSQLLRSRDKMLQLQRGLPGYGRGLTSTSGLAPLQRCCTLCLKRNLQTLI